MAKPLTISKEEFAERREKFLSRREVNASNGVLLFSPTSIFYFVGFHFIPTERPMALLLKQNGSSVLFVPRLEQEHAEKVALVDKVVSYPEYPGEKHPMVHLVKLLKSEGCANGALAVDADRYMSPWGYRGPSLGELLPELHLNFVGGIVEEMRMTKSPAEIALIRESCRWGNLAHALLQKYAVPGAKEIEISNRASAEATAAMIETLGPIYRPAGSATAFAGFRGQIGPNSALPHAVTVNATLRPGDTLVTGASADVYGYHSELERTMFVGEPSAEQRKFFEWMLAAQDLAFSLIKPGIPCSAVEKEMQRFYRENGLVPYTRHHTGHNIGLQGHEMPFLDVGDDTIIQPGMLFTVEPGLYVNGLGGFRHSDTVVVTETGIEFLTYYPRDLESLICG
jgi:Xaa-Pro dipeptidase